MTMSRVEWGTICRATSAHMRLHMMPFVTPISRPLGEAGELVGSGGYVNLGPRQLLLTNEHVANQPGQLQHKFYDAATYFPIIPPFPREPHPMDCAAAVVDQSWAKTDHSAMAFPEHLIATSHSPAATELLFMLGFADQRSYYSPFNNVLVTNGTPYLTQAFDPAREPAEDARKIASTWFDPKYHFALHWNPDQMETVDEKNTRIPDDPHGFSGSLVWNTRRIECANAQTEWTPGLARLTGIVWGWDTADRLLFATRIEHVLAFLKRLP